MKRELTEALAHQIYWDAQPRRTIAFLTALMGSLPISDRAAAIVYEQGIAIWREVHARLETLPHGNDLQCLILLNRYANQLRACNLNVPDFMFLSTAEYEAHRSQPYNQSLREHF